jgi:predicted CxxxxCH...CXXCH cytochrome family protein
MKHSLSIAAGIALAAVSFGCTKARSLADDPRLCPNWQTKIGPVFQERCSQCHSSGTGTPQGGYDVSTYNLALGSGTPPPVVAGASDSRLLTVLNPVTATASHQGMEDVYALARTWVVDCRATFLDESISVHSAGVMDPTQPDFHGRHILDNNYDLRLCQSCHGQDLQGGSSQVNCLDCHQGTGAKACGSCHAYPPATAAHTIHAAGGLLAKQIACSTCHPNHQSAKDHGYGADGLLRTSPALVVLSGLAASGTRTAPPAWDPASRTCKNVYCHGATMPDSAAVTSSPSWDASPRPATQACTYCHGVPPNGAGGRRCSNCHSSVVDANFTLVSTVLHLNGTVDFADPNTPCSTCHGSPASNAPPPDLQGSSDPAAKGVGQHQRHLTSPLLGIRGPIQCSECHQVPVNANSSGHFGAGHAPGTVAAATVFPIVAGSGTLARAQSASPKWDSTLLTCAGTYCHGGGEPLNIDKTVGLMQMPSWVTPDSGDCGTACHGLPPLFSGHPTGIARTGCVGCHAKTIDATGNIVFTGAPDSQTTTHMNGTFDGN